MAEEAQPHRSEEQPRKAYLKRGDFKRFGYTEDCEGCNMMAGMTARPHKDTCRQRMENNLQKEENPRWKRARDQTEEKFWEAIKEEEQGMEEEKKGDADNEEEAYQGDPVLEEKVARDKRPAEANGRAGSGRDPASEPENN